MAFARNCTLVVALMTTVLVATTASAAQDPSADQTEAARLLVPVQLLVTISEYDGDTRTSSLPYMLWVIANETQQAYVSAVQQVPVPQTESVPPEGFRASTARSFSYTNVGATITVRRVWTMEDGRFGVDLNIDDSTVMPATEAGDLVRIKSLSAQNVRLLLREDQTAEFLAASDRITGSMTRIEVTLTVLD